MSSVQTPVCKRAPRRFRSVLFRLLLAFLLVLTPLFVTGLSLYNYGVEMLDGQVTSLLTRQLDFKTTEMESQIDMARKQVSALLGERSTLRVSGYSMLMSPYERIDALNMLQTRLNAIHNASPFIRLITLYLPRIDRQVLSAVVPADAATIAELDRDAYESARATGGMDVNLVSWVNGAPMFVEQTPMALALTPAQEPRALTTMQIDIGRIGRYLNDVAPGSQTYHYVAFTDGRVASFAGGDALFEEIAPYLEDEDDPGSSVRTVRIDGEDYYVVSRACEALGARLVICSNRTLAFSALRLYRTLFITMIACLAVAVLAYSFFAYRSVHTPLKLLADAFDRLADGDMDFRLSYRKLDEFQYLMDRFNQMLNRLKATMAQLYQQRILMQQAQLKQLQAQINPHFLYNSFYTLENMIALEDNESAALFSNCLGRYFQYVTRDKRDMVSLRDEVKHALSYVEIQRIRFSGRLEVCFSELPESIEDITVPRLTLQPILENAFEHSLEKYDGVGELTVTITEAPDGAMIDVENNAVPDAAGVAGQMREALNDTSAQREITGLINVHRRLILTHGVGLTVEARGEDRLAVVVRLRKASEQNQGRECL